MRATKSARVLCPVHFSGLGVSFLRSPTLRLNPSPWSQLLESIRGYAGTAQTARFAPSQNPREASGIAMSTDRRDSPLVAKSQFEVEEEK